MPPPFVVGCFVFGSRYFVQGDSWCATAASSTITAPVKPRRDSLGCREGQGSPPPLCPTRPRTRVRQAVKYRVPVHVAARVDVDAVYFKVHFVDVALNGVVGVWGGGDSLEYRTPLDLPAVCVRGWFEGTDDEHVTAVASRIDERHEPARDDVGPSPGSAPRQGRGRRARRVLLVPVARALGGKGRVERERVERGMRRYDESKCG
ncbi:hypothetical protein C8R45DRAFT_1113793 [Mycena sanguinolenta]|nr:hypothetical protein C8R45DRAFT_1113793 [Mycena sanguinolenta]